MATLFDFVWPFSGIFEAHSTTAAKSESESFLLPGLRSPSRFSLAFSQACLFDLNFVIASIAFIKVLVLLEICCGLKLNLECYRLVFCRVFVVALTVMLVRG